MNRDIRHKYIYIHFSSVHQGGSHGVEVILLHILPHLFLSDPHVVHQLLSVQLYLSSSVLSLQEKHLGTNDVRGGGEAVVIGEKGRRGTRKEVNSQVRPTLLR